MRKNKKTLSIILVLALIITGAFTGITIAGTQTNMHSDFEDANRVLILLDDESNSLAGIKDRIDYDEFNLPEYFNLEEAVGEDINVTHAIECERFGGGWRPELGDDQEAVQNAVVGAVVVYNNPPKVYFLPLTDVRGGEGIYVGEEGVGTGTLNIWAYIKSISPTIPTPPTIDPIQVTKVIQSNDPEVINPGFDFLLFNGDSVVGTAKVVAEEMTFDSETSSASKTVTFEMKDDFTLPANGIDLIMKEVKGTTENWTYDVSWFKVKIDANGAISYEDEEGNPIVDALPVFTNTYTKPSGGNTDPTLDAIQVEKKITSESTPPEKVFEFELVREQEVVATVNGEDAVVSTASITGEGTEEFDMTGFTLPEQGSIDLIMREVQNPSENWTYDQTEYIVTVNADGSVTYKDKESNSLADDAIPVFTNIYTEPTTDPTLADIQVKKEITGDSNPPSTTFNFKLFNGDAEVGTASITGEGTATFKNVSVTLPKEGTLELVMQEVIPESQGYWDYDESKYIVSVGTDGSVTYKTDGEESQVVTIPVFTNDYDRPSGGNSGGGSSSSDPDPGKIEITKVVAGDGSPKGIPFKLYKDGELLKRGETNAEGILVFDGLEAASDYTLEEIVPEGYTSNLDKNAKIAVNEDKTTKVTVVNTPIPAPPALEEQPPEPPAPDVAPIEEKKELPVTGGNPMTYLSLGTLALGIGSVLRKRS